MTFLWLVALLLVQRLGEISRGNQNLRALLPDLITPLDKKEKLQMMLLHSLWFAAILAEYFIHGKLVAIIPFVTGIIILLWCQYIRYQSMKLLGVNWTQFPVAVKGQKISLNGPYKYIRHPNYLIVMIEVLVLPLLGGCYFSAIIFSIINFIFLSRRIRIEEAALQKVSKYQEHFAMKKKMIPFIFGLLLFNLAHAETIIIKAKDFDEAKKGETYFMFSSESTKFGFVTTSFEGYATNGKLDYKTVENKLQEISLEIVTKGIDTDNSSRNEKMYNESLDSSKFPIILVKIESIDRTQDTQEIPAYMTVRGKTIPLKLMAKKINDKTIKGKTSFTLSEAGIPDPSIAIAKVRDRFDIEFQVKLP